ncbi:MAG: hypothetical protein ABR568_16000, partial [Pyrinomonadaceae bacterium]
MKRSVSVLVALVITAGCVVSPLATAQTKPTSLGVALTNAYDAFGSEREGLKHDFGFSTIVEYKGKTILFDAGTNAEVFENNLK